MSQALIWSTAGILIVIVTCYVHSLADSKKKEKVEAIFQRYLTQFGNAAAQQFVAHANEYVKVRKEGSHSLRGLAGSNLSQGRLLAAFASSLLGQMLDSRKKCKLTEAVLGQNGKSGEQLEAEHAIIAYLLRNYWWPVNIAGATAVFLTLMGILLFIKTASDRPQIPEKMSTSSPPSVVITPHNATKVSQTTKGVVPIEIESLSGVASTPPKLSPNDSSLEPEVTKSKGAGVVSAAENMASVDPNNLTLRNKDGREIHVQFLALTNSTVLARTRDGNSVEVSLSTLTDETVARIKLARELARNR